MQVCSVEAPRDVRGYSKRKFQTTINHWLGTDNIFVSDYSLNEFGASLGDDQKC
jgi:hypothetical protein